LITPLLYQYGRTMRQVRRGLWASLLESLRLQVFALGASAVRRIIQTQSTHQALRTQPTLALPSASDGPQSAWPPQPREDAWRDEPMPHIPAAARKVMITRVPGPVSAQRPRRLAQPWRRVTPSSPAAGWRLSAYGVRLLQRTRFPIAVVETYTLVPQQHPYGQPVSRRDRELAATA
jgi:hypothetical protein